MPPIRSLSAAKPIKTERTHEENQERAYIAASRRSDRSLEARIESARRASEIHKRRTGRSLRVTEQDVVNEEMYEEEDDDLPMQYRRLTAHLDTNSADFNRRLASYLTNHVAMRSALNQAISNSYPQQTPTNNNILNNQQWQQSMQPPQTMQSSQNMQNAPQMQWPQPSPQYSNGVVPPQMLHRPSVSSRHQPYPSSPNSAFPSVVKPQSQFDMRRPSLSLKPQQQQQQYHQSSPSMVHPMAAPATHKSPSLAASHRSNSVASVPSLTASDEDETTSHGASRKQSSNIGSPQYPTYQQNWGIGQPPVDIAPLTTSMPPETQMFFGGGNGFNTFYDMPMEFNPKMQHNYYTTGMSQTLAPGAGAENTKPEMAWDPATGGDYASAGHFGFESEFNDHDTFSKLMMPGSGQLTPADQEWSSYLNTSTWDDTET